MAVQSRVGGQGFTTFVWQGNVIGFAQQVSYESPTPVAPATPIHPMDKQYAVEILLPQAANPGTIRLELIEPFNAKVWDRLKLLKNANDIVEVFQRIAQADEIQVTKTIYPADKKGSPQIEIFHNVVVSNILDGETIEVGTMQIIKQMELMYTHVSTFGRKTPSNT